MSYLLAYLIIGTIKLIKWTIFKTRLWIAAIPIAILLIFFNDWYQEHALLADIIGILLIVGVLVSWIFTLIKFIKDKKQEREYLIKKAYEKYGEPVVLKKLDTNNVTTK